MTENLPIQTGLRVQGLEVAIHLGWPDNERKDAQSVFLDIEIDFFQPPLACQTDELQDTLCYAALARQIKEATRGHYFHLIEHLAREIYLLVKSRLATKDSVMIHLTKHPKIVGLGGGVCISYGDRKK